MGVTEHIGNTGKRGRKKKKGCTINKLAFAGD